MKELDFMRLTEASTSLIVDKYLNDDPAVVALKVGDAAVATQIKYLQRARKKLPSWFDRRCLIDSTLYEQSSSEITAQQRFLHLQSEDHNNIALDLTCGLGVDSWALSSHFKQVIAIEIDPIKAQIAKHNFSLLGSSNIEVVSDSAENFIQNAINKGLKTDLIYVDPSRVACDSKRVYSIEQSSPNVLKMMGLLNQISTKVIIKLSPLFDVDECFSVFENVDNVTVISLNSECKEVIVSIDSSHQTTQPTVNLIVINKDRIRNFIFPALTPKRCNFECSIEKMKFLYVPDVAFYKARKIAQYVSQITENFDYIYSSYLFLTTALSDFAGVGYCIDRTMIYNEKKIKQLLASYNIKRATIHLRDFPIDQRQLYKALKIREGGDAHIFFTTVEGELMFFLVTLLKTGTDETKFQGKII